MFKRRPKAPKIHTIAEIDQLASSGKPVLIDFYQTGCAPCQVMDGIMNELAREFGESAHVVKADIANMPDAMQKFKIRSTPTMVLLSTAPPKKAKKNRNRQAGTPGGRRAVTQRWRASGLVQKDQLTRLLESNGAQKISA
ncbi:MAG: thioredoxin family protein [Actinomycetota bacterium]